MTNYPFESIETFNDVAEKNEYHIVKEQGGDINQLLNKYNMENRDNSRTPMQWNDTKNAGFTNGRPWFPVNPNYKVINVERQRHDNHSILQFYKKLIQLKKSDDVYTYGTFNMMDNHNSKLFAYTRKLNDKTALIVGNLTDQMASLELPFELNDTAQVKLHNYQHNKIDIKHVKPYEDFVLEL